MDKEKKKWKKKTGRVPTTVRSNYRGPIFMNCHFLQSGPANVTKN